MATHRPTPARPMPPSTRPLTPDERAGARVLLSTERGDPLLLARPGQLLIAMDSTGAVRRWPYFNYLLHAAANAAAGRQPPRFADWNGSPLVGPRLRRAIA